MTRGRMAAAALAGLLLLPASARAHSVHTASIRIAIDGANVTVTERIPLVAGQRLEVVLSPACLLVESSAPREHGRFVSFRDGYRCSDEPTGIEVRGLDATLGEAWIVVDRGGHRLAGAVRRDAPSLDLRESATPTLDTYLRLGVEHVLGGIDHLLFVLGLLMVVRIRGRERWLRRTVATVTAFTVAHSITLGLATFGRVTLPAAPVEIGIALSILLLADELARAPSRERPSWTVRHPAIVAFLFGLLHGFGFAGALSEVGIPPDRAVAALALFNAGVELGQLAFVSVVVVLLAGARRFRRSSDPPAARPLAWAVYGLGGAAFYFLLDRLTAGA